MIKRALIKRALIKHHLALKIASGLNFSYILTFDTNIWPLLNALDQR